jgi:hypothetical protein
MSITVRITVGHVDNLPKCEHDRIPGYCECWRRYHVWSVNERNGAEVCMTKIDGPVTHAEARTIISKLTHYIWRRLEIREVQL